MHPFYDSDLGTVIGVASEPVIDEEKRKVFKRYQLFKDRSVAAMKARQVTMEPLEIVG